VKTESGPSGALRVNLILSLAAERGALWQLLVGLEEATLAQQAIVETWTVKDLLAHIASWDDLYAERVQLFVEGRLAEAPSVTMDARNAKVAAERRDWSLEKAVDACVSARESFLFALEGVSDDDLVREQQFPWGDTGTIQKWVTWRARHDRTHAAQIDEWRQKHSPIEGLGPKAVLLAALQAGRDELLSAVDAVPPDQRSTLLVTDQWSLKDVLGHVADWDAFLIDIAKHVGPNAMPKIFFDGDIPRWNRVQRDKRKDQPWNEISADFHRNRFRLLDIYRRMTQQLLEQTFWSPWGSHDTAYRFGHVWFEHDREHAAAIRAVAARLV
jgi:hypothetical protein